MPSGAKRRKAVVKKKKMMMQVVMDEGVEVLAGDSVVQGEDTKTQEERDTDSSGETGSPVSQDQHYPFGEGVEDSMKGDKVEGDIGDDGVVELGIKDERDSKDCGETGVDEDLGCQSPVKEGIKVLDETELLLVQHDLQEIPDEITNGNACSDYPRSPHEGDVDGCVDKVYPGPEDLDSLHTLGKDNQGFNDLSFPSQDRTVEVANGDAFNAHQSVLLTDVPVKIMSATENEEKVIDCEGLGLAVESDNFEEVVKKYLIMGTNLPNELVDPVNWLPEVAPLTSTADPASLLQNGDISGASPFKEPGDSISSPEEPKERILSVVCAVSGVDVPNFTLNDASEKLIPVIVAKAGTPEGGSESFVEDIDGERMPSSGCLITEVDNGAEKCDAATLTNNSLGSDQKENSVAKLEDGPDKSNFAANGNEAFLKVNGHGDESILGVVIAQNGHYKEKNNDLEIAHNDIDNQLGLPNVPRGVRKASWTGCCGLLDVITGSVR